MRTGARLLAVLALVVAAGAAGAQQGPGQVQSPILTLDQERLFTGSRAAEQISQEIEQKAGELAAENRSIEAELVAEELDLTTRRATLPVAEFRALADAFDEKVQRIRTEQDAKARELQQLREQQRQTFLRRISPILAEIVRERGALAVLGRRTVQLSADSIDITDEAISRINAALDGGVDLFPPGTVNDPAPELPVPGMNMPEAGNGDPALPGDQAPETAPIDPVQP